MITIQNYQLNRKSGDRASLLIEHSIQVINNNKTKSSWTAEEKRNPVIGQRQVQTFVTLSLAIVKSQESGKMLSGGNFDFKDNIGKGYVLELKYRQNDEAVKELAKWLRELNFSCIVGGMSASCFMPNAEAEDSAKGDMMDNICTKIESSLTHLIHHSAD
jgi:hypothetical protein